MRSNLPLCLQLSSSSICEVQHQLMEEVHKLNFVKENSSATFIERKLSLEKKKPVPSPVSIIHLSPLKNPFLITFETNPCLYHSEICLLSLHWESELCYVNEAVPLAGNFLRLFTLVLLSWKSTWDHLWLSLDLCAHVKAVYVKLDCFSC